MSPFVPILKGAHLMIGVVQPGHAPGPGTRGKLLQVIAAVMLAVGLFVGLPLLMLAMSRSAREGDQPGAGQPSPAAQTCAKELADLDAAIQKFKYAYKIDYLPSRFVLAERLSDYVRRPNDPLWQDSLAYLLRLW